MAIQPHELTEAQQKSLHSWNWGAFFLTWIWGLGNKSYLGLLVFVLGTAGIFFSLYINYPALALIIAAGLFGMRILYGIKGRRWAWQNKTWKSFEHFQKIQKRWAKIGFSLFALIFAAIFYGLFSLYQVIAEPAREISQALVKNETIQQTLGNPIKTSFFAFPHAFFVVKDAMGKNLVALEFSMKLYGSKKTANVKTASIKNDGIWTFLQVEVITLDDKKPLEFQSNSFLTNLLETKAAGHPEAEYILGMEYISQKKYKEGIKWLERAVQHGHMKAANNLGTLYDQGKGVVKNKQKELELYHFAAAKGDNKAMYNIGLTHLRDTTLKNHQDLAKEWFQKSINQGGYHFCPSNDLGMLYANREYKDYDPQQALFLFEQSTSSLMKEPTIHEVLDRTYAKRKDLNQTPKEFADEVVNAFADQQFLKSNHESETKLKADYAGNVVEAAEEMAKKIKVTCWD